MHASSIPGWVEIRAAGGWEFSGGRNPRISAAFGSLSMINCFAARAFLSYCSSTGGQRSQ